MLKKTAFTAVFLISVVQSNKSYQATKNQIPILHFQKVKKTGKEADMVNRVIAYHRNLIFPHHYSFCQVLYVAEGGGKHIIDFETNPVKAASLYRAKKNN